LPSYPLGSARTSILFKMANDAIEDAVVCSTLGMFIMDIFDFGTDRPPIEDQVRVAPANIAGPLASSSLLMPYQ
jgi:hypothetical protein